jgi:hypothetical protein
MTFSKKLWLLKLRSLITAFVFIIPALSYKICLSARYGKLSAELTYDDISYFSEGMRYVSSFKQAPWHLFNALFDQPPSEPFLAAISFFTQYFFHEHVALIYFCSDLVISFLVLCLARIIFRNFRNSLVVTSIFILSPFSSFYLMNYRPDTFFSLIFAIIVAMTISDFKKYFLWMPTLIWLLFLSKPHYLVFVGLLLVYLLTLTIRYDYVVLFFRKKFLKSVVFPSVISIFLFWNGFKQTVIYIYANTYGNQVHWWKGSESVLTVLESNLINFARNNGGIFFCSFFLLYILFGLKLNVKYFSSKKKTILPLCMLLIGTFLIATFGGTPSAFFFLPFSSTVLVLAFISSKNIPLVFWKKKTIPLLQVSMLVILILRGFLPVDEWGAASMKVVGDRNTMLAKFVDQNSSGQTLVTFIGPVNMDALNVYSHHKFWKPPQENFQFAFLQSGSDKDINTYVKSFLDYNNILFCNSFDNTTNMHIPNNSHQKEMELAMIKFYGESNFNQLTYGSFTLFERRNQNGGRP